MTLAEFHFLRPYCLLALLPLAIVIWLLMIRKLGDHSWASVCDRDLLPHILIGDPDRTHHHFTLFIALCGLLGILALAGPTWERIPQPLYRNDNALVIALDLSRSMDASDIAPSRLERARYKIADLLQARRDGQTALIVYAAEAFVVSPLTDDIKTITSQLSALSTSIMPAQGSVASTALSKATSLFKQAGLAEGHVLLVTDGLDAPDIEDAITEVRQNGYRTSILGVGSEQGSPITLPDGGFLKDKSGTIVVPKTDQQQLKRISMLGGGRYQQIQADDSDIETLNGFFNGQTMREEESQTELKADVWKDQGPWLLLLLLPFAALSFRRGYLVIAFALLLPVPEDAYAFEWNNLWLNENQQALKKFNANEAEAAAEQFSDPEWKAAAKYRAGDYQSAMELLQGITTPDSHYNQGNALARQGKYQEALAAYDESLKLDPTHEDALFNRELVAKALEKQQQQQQQQQEQQGDSSENDESNKQEQQGDKQQASENNETSETQSGQQEQSDSEQQSQQQQAETAGSDSEQEQPKQQQDAEATKQAHEPSEDDNNETETSSTMTANNDELPDEAEQATEQWLRRIPDDPAGLWRRKFLYQYQQQGRNQRQPQQDW